MKDLFVDGEISSFLTACPDVTWQHPTPGAFAQLEKKLTGLEDTIGYLKQKVFNLLMYYVAVLIRIIPLN